LSDIDIQDHTNEEKGLARKKNHEYSREGFLKKYFFFFLLLFFVPHK